MAKRRGYNGSKTEPSESDEYRTPDYVYGWADRRFGFRIDLAATRENARCDRWISKRENALAIDWSSQFLRKPVGWCNPPYSRIDPWLAKAIEEQQRGFTTVFLIPTPNGDARDGMYIHGVASEVIFISGMVESGRLSFIQPNGKPKSGNNRGSCFVVYRAYDVHGFTRYSCVTRAAMLEEWRERGGEATA